LGKKRTVGQLWRKTGKKKRGTACRIFPSSTGKKKEREEGRGIVKSLPFDIKWKKISPSRRKMTGPQKRKGPALSVLSPKGRKEKKEGTGDLDDAREEKRERPSRWGPGEKGDRLGFCLFFFQRKRERESFRCCLRGGGGGNAEGKKISSFPFGWGGKKKKKRRGREGKKREYSLEQSEGTAPEGAEEGGRNVDHHFHQARKLYQQEGDEPPGRRRVLLLLYGHGEKKRREEMHSNSLRFLLLKVDRIGDWPEKEGTLKKGGE